MKLPDDVQKPLAGLVPVLGWRAAAALLLPLLLAAGAYLYRLYKARQAEKKAAPAVPPKAPEAKAALDRSQLRRAWKRFLAKLPWKIRRSILSFEQFVVLGAEGAGKSELIKTYSDWERQEGALLASMADDKDLNVYLASHALIMELPSKILHDHGVEARKALEELFRPLYRLRSPTVVVVVDASALINMPDSQLTSLAGAIRGKINLLSVTRGRSLEVRVALTRIEAISGAEGYVELARMCRAEGMGLLVPLSRQEKVGESLEAWLNEAKLQLPRLLTSLDAVSYRRVVRFFQKAPQLFSSGSKLDQFLDTLFIHDAISPDPDRGGLFLACEPAGQPSPLRAARRRERAPDPQVRHLVAATLAASMAVTYLGFAYLQQLSRFRAASGVLKNYIPSAQESESEQRQRETIEGFTQPGIGLGSWPDFFARPRQYARLSFSMSLRELVLIEQLRSLMQLSAPVPGSPITMRFQRSLFLLGLIHSDRFDQLQILGREENGRDRLKLWSEMTGVGPEIISAYLLATDAPYREAVPPYLLPKDIDTHNSGKPWQDFAAKLKYVQRHGLEPRKLAELQEQATALKPQVVRLENADLILEMLDSIRSYGLSKEDMFRRDSDENKQAMALDKAYRSKYAEFLQGYMDFKGTYTSELREVLRIVASGDVSGAQPSGQLRDLVSSLELMYEKENRSSPPHGFVLKDEFVPLKESDWNELIRDARASLLINAFMQADNNRQSIFFKPGSSEFAPVSWNAGGTAATIFAGQSLLDARYTRAAYEGAVRATVLRLRAVLDKLNEDDDERHIQRTTDRGRLVQAVQHHVEVYIDEYRQQAQRFVRGFEVSASSEGELRLALTEMSDKSGSGTFDEFLRLVDRNTSLDRLNPRTKLEEPMLQPVRRLTDEFAHFHEVVDGNGAPPRINQYKSILDQMLKDMSASADAEGGDKPASLKKAPEGGGKGGDTLEDALTPTGRLALAGMRREPGAYPALIQGWIRASGLNLDQQHPFRVPAIRLDSIGRSEVASTVGRTVRKTVLPPIEAAVSRFPFNSAADEEIAPEQLNELFNPKTGRFFEMFRKYLEPVSDVNGGQGFRVRDSVKEGIDLPEGMFRLINAAGLLSARLWDESGKPRPLSFKLTTVPFGGAPSDVGVVSLVFVQVGDASLVNFNQKPTTKTLELDWTKPSASRVGVQLTDIRTKDSTVPKPLAVEGSAFSFLKLLKKATRTPVDPNQPSGPQLYTWEVILDSGAKVRAQVILAENPWEIFSLARAVSAAGMR